MKHEHLPALNKYTSKPQYEAMQKIEQTGSLIELISQGRMGTTIGALLRSAWVSSEVVTGANSGTGDRWFVTDAGKHAMKLYEIKLEQERKKEEAAEETLRIIAAQRQQRAEQEQLVINLLTNYYTVKQEHKKQITELWQGALEAGMRAGMDRDSFTRVMASVSKKVDIDADRDREDW
jgi:hypothetical protein